MAKGFFDIEHTEPEQIGTSSSLAANTQDERERAIDRQEADRLKESITRQLESGTEPQIILLTAVKAIGLYAGDLAFTAAAEEKIDAIYSDLAQQSFIQDNAEIARQRLETQQTEYREKARKGIQRQLTATRRIEHALLDALQAVNAAEPDADPFGQQTPSTGGR